MKIVINILKFIVMLVLVLCVLFFGLKNIAFSTILNKDYVLNKLEETNFYSGTFELVKSGFENYIAQSGLEEEALNNICTEEKVKNDIGIIINNIYNGTNEDIDTTEIANNLNANIDKLNVRTPQNQKALDKFVDQICTEYKDTILNTKYENTIHNALNKVIQIMEKLQTIILIVTIIGIICIILLNVKNIYKLVGNIGTILFSSSLVILIAIKLLNVNVNISAIKLFNNTFSNSIVTVLQDIINKLNNFGLILLIISIILIILNAVIYILKFKETNNKTKSENISE